LKYLVNYKFDPKDFDKVIPMFQEMVKMREQSSPDYPKALTPTYGIVGDMTGFFIAEADSPAQLSNHYLHYHPIIQFTWHPIDEAANVIKSYMKRKKP
jgi:hypothetical protein